jgi:hypothetical protein
VGSTKINAFWQELRCQIIPQAARQLGLGILAEHVPATLIDEVLTATGRVQQRIRRLPAWVTVLFILALTLFANRGYPPAPAWCGCGCGCPMSSRATSTGPATTVPGNG